MSRIPTMGLVSLLLPFLLVTLPMVLCVQYHTLDTPLGRVTGLHIQDGPNIIYQFRNIPFAKPPIGARRFMKPEPIEAWTGIHDGTMYGPSCIQEISKPFLDVLENKNVSEDCLHLNVYTAGDLSPSANKSVMVFFHGGGYMQGQAQLYDGSHLAVSGDVVVVAANYRVGVLGFFSTGDSVAKGNYGLWDQIEALKWVQNNIKSFGGNPKSVTIFGESAGGFSVSILSTIPTNRGLFHRVIAQSGTYTSPYAINRKPSEFAIRFSYIARCKNIQTSQAMFDCVRELPADAILQSQKSALSLGALAPGSLFVLPIGPTVDGDLIKSDPMESIQNSSSDGYAFYRSLDVMAGCVSAEGSLLLMTVFPALEAPLGFNTSEGVPTSVLKTVFARAVAVQLYNNHSNVWRAIVDKFGSSDNQVQARKIVDMYGDLFFFQPMIQAVQLHSKNNTNGVTYQYLFSQPGVIPLFGPLPSWFRGTEHGAELMFLFGIDRLPGVVATPAIVNFANTIITYWTNFAKFGDPSREDITVRWPEYDANTRNYLNLVIPISQETAMFQDRVKFWEKDLPLVALEKDMPSAASTTTIREILLFVSGVILVLCCL